MRSKDFLNRHNIQKRLSQSGEVSADTGHERRGETWLRVVVENAASGNSIQIEGKLKGQTAWQNVGSAVAGNSAGTTIDVKDVDLFRIKGAVIVPADATVEVQKVAFSAVPDAGAWKLNFAGDVTGALAFDISAADLQTAVRTLTGLEAATVTGDFTAGFTITMTGYNGNAPAVTVSDNTLEAAAVAVTTTITTETPGVASPLGGTWVVVSGFYN